MIVFVDETKHRASATDHVLVVVSASMNSSVNAPITMLALAFMCSALFQIDMVALGEIEFAPIESLAR